MVAGAAADPGDGGTMEARVYGIEQELITLVNKLKEYEQQQDSGNTRSLARSPTRRGRWWAASQNYIRRWSRP